METGLLYNSLDECLKAEASMRAEWAKVSESMPTRFQQNPVGHSYIEKQTTTGTCIPHAERGRGS